MWFWWNMCRWCEDKQLKAMSIVTDSTIELLVLFIILGTPQVLPELKVTVFFFLLLTKEISSEQLEVENRQDSFVGQRHFPLLFQHLSYSDKYALCNLKKPFRIVRSIFQFLAKENLFPHFIRFQLLFLMFYGIILGVDSER